MLGLSHRGFRLHDYQQHIVHTLGKAGYFSALSGVQHVAVDPETIGYDVILSRKEGYWPDGAEAAQAAVDFLRGDRREPFFLSVGFQPTGAEWQFKL